MTTTNIQKGHLIQSVSVATSAKKPLEGAVIQSKRTSYHPDFGDVRNSAVLLKHPLVVGEQQFEAESERQDEREPQQSAKNQR